MTNKVQPYGGMLCSQTLPWEQEAGHKIWEVRELKSQDVGKMMSVYFEIPRHCGRCGIESGRNQGQEPSRNDGCFQVTEPGEQGRIRLKTRGSSLVFREEGGRIVQKCQEDVHPCPPWSVLGRLQAPHHLRQPRMLAPVGIGAVLECQPSLCSRGFRGRTPGLGRLGRRWGKGGCTQSLLRGGAGGRMT